MRTDCLILGGGIIGCAVALELRARKVEVTVVERGPIAGEASSAAAGILAPQAEAGGPGPLLELARASRALYPAWAESLRAATGIDIAYRTDGALVVALHEHELDLLRARQAWQTAAGLQVERLSAAEVRALEPALGETHGALRFAGDHQVDNRRLARAVEQAAAQAGVRFVSAQARRVLHDGARVTGADLDGTPQVAGQVVLACGSWSALLDGAGLPAQAVVPIRGQMIELETRPPPLRHVVFGDDGYLVPRADGRVLCGSTEEHAGFRKEVTPAGLERLARRVARLCPALGEARVARSWSGLRPGTADGLPLLGPTALVGLHLATGHFRNGILLAPITARLIASIVTGERTAAGLGIDLAPFSVARLG